MDYRVKSLSDVRCIVVVAVDEHHVGLALASGPLHGMLRPDPGPCVPGAAPESSAVRGTADTEEESDAARSAGARMGIPGVGPEGGAQQHAGRAAREGEEVALVLKLPRSAKLLKWISAFDRAEVVGLEDHVLERLSDPFMDEFAGCLGNLRVLQCSAKCASTMLFSSWGIGALLLKCPFLRELDLRCLAVEYYLELSPPSGEFLERLSIPRALLMDVRGKAPLPALKHAHIRCLDEAVVADFVRRASGLVDLELHLARRDRGPFFLPLDLGLLRQLKSLRLAGPSFEGLPESAGLLTQLEELSIGDETEPGAGPVMCDLPDEGLPGIGDLPRLRQLALHSYSMRTLPGPIWHMASLRALRLTCSTRFILPDDWSGLANLEHLQLQQMAFRGQRRRRSPKLTEWGKGQGEAQGRGRDWEAELGEASDEWAAGVRALHTSLGALKALKTLCIDSPLLKDLPPSPHWLSTLERLELRNCAELAHFPGWSLQGWSLQRLESLSVSNCPAVQSLMALHPGRVQEVCLVECPSLQGLEAAFQGAHGVTSLALDCLLAARFPWDLLAGSLQHLKFLECSAGRRADCSHGFAVPGAVGALPSLRSLSLSRCTRELPESLARATELREIQEVGSLVYVPPAVLELPSLASATSKRLWARLEWLEQQEVLAAGWLPSSLSNFQGLRRLKVEGSRQHYLPYDLGALSLLAYVDIERCHKLEELPASMNAMRSLHSLTIRDCVQLRGLPPGVVGVKGIAQIEVQGCPEFRLRDERMSHTLCHLSITD